MIDLVTVNFLKKYICKEYEHIPEDLKSHMFFDADKWFIFDGTNEELVAIQKDLDVSVEVRVKSFVRPGEELRHTMRPHFAIMALVKDEKPYLLFDVGDPDCLNIFASEWLKYESYKREGK